MFNTVEDFIVVFGYKVGDICMITDIRYACGGEL